MMKKLFTIMLALVAMTGCTKPDRSEEEKTLRYELRDQMLTNPEQALARVDSAEQAGLFSASTANVFRVNVYKNMGQRRLAIYYGEQILHNPEMRSGDRAYYSALLVVNNLLETNGEYGKAIRMADEIIADMDKELKQYGGNSEGLAANTKDVNYQVALRMKSHMLIFKGECEKNLGHIDEAERYYLEGINLMMDGMSHPNDYWVIDALFYGVLETTDYYLENGMPEKTLDLVAKGDTALARLERCHDVPDVVLTMRRNNITISQAMVYAANGQPDKAEALYQKHRQAEGLSEIDIAADARYLTMTGRYDEAISLFRQADSLYLAKGSPVSEAYIKFYMMRQYEALQKSGRKDEALALGDHMRQLTDSIHVEERRTDVEQEQEIRQKETEIATRRQSLIVHRIILCASVLICLFIAYFLWRSHLYNKALLEKNRRLLAEIEQREQEREQAIEQLKAEPEESLTTEQQLFRRICDLMESSERIYTDATLDRSRLAQLLGTNEHYVTDAISACTNGKSVNGFVNEYRLRYATHLLATTKDAITLIAELAGFSRSSFFRIFSEAYGMSPSDYRKVARR